MPGTLLLIGRNGPPLGRPGLDLLGGVVVGEAVGVVVEGLVVDARFPLA